MEEGRECLRIVRALIEIESVYVSDGIEGRLRISGGKMKKEFRYQEKRDG